MVVTSGESLERSIKIIRAVAGQERIRSAVHLTAWTPEAGRPYAGPPWVSPSPVQRAVSHSRLELSSWTGCRRRSARQSSVGGGGRGGSLSGSGPASFKGPRKGLPAMGMGKARLPPRPEAGNKRPGSVARGCVGPADKNWWSRRPRVGLTAGQARPEEARQDHRSPRFAEVQQANPNCHGRPAAMAYT